MYTNLNTLRIIWKFDLNSLGVLGRIYALIIEVLTVFLYLHKNLVYIKEI